MPTPDVPVERANTGVRLLVTAAVLLTCVLFTRAALDPVNVIKLTALALAALAVAATAGVNTIRTHVVVLPLSAVGAAVGLLVIGLVVATASAPVTSMAIVGTYGRNSGLLAYLSAIVLFLVSMRVFARSHARALVLAIACAGLFTSVYGFFQLAGADPIPWSNPFNPMIAALGNPNFASAYVGISAAVSCGGALWSGWAVGWRVLCAITAGSCLLAAVMSESSQGPLATLVGLFVVALAWSLNLQSRFRRWSLLALGALGTCAAAVMAVGLRGSGPAAGVFLDSGARARLHYWRAAVEMFREEPITGVGLDQFGSYWRSVRSPQAVRDLGGYDFSDAAHSVPLQMLAQGGLFLAVGYVAFLAITLAALVTGLRRLQGQDRLLFAAIGGGWAAYQVQSVVSIDQVPLIVVHFTLSGALVALAGTAGLREVRLPGALAKAPQTFRTARPGKRRPINPAAPRRRPVTAWDFAAGAVLCVLVLTAAWASLIPIRANVAAKNGDELRALGDGTAAYQQYSLATRLLPGESSYWLRVGNLFQQASPPQRGEAKQAFLAAYEHDPMAINAILAAASLAEGDGDLRLARSLHERSVRIDPLNPDTLAAAATFELRHEGAVKARSLMTSKVSQLPFSPLLWATLGDARLVTGDHDGARTAYQRALELQSDQAAALEGLRKLGVAR